MPNMTEDEYKLIFSSSCEINLLENNWNHIIGTNKSFYLSYPNWLCRLSHMVWDKFACVFNTFPTHWRITRVRIITSTGNSFNIKLFNRSLHSLSNWLHVSGKLSQFFPQQFLRVRAHSSDKGTHNGLLIIFNNSCKISFGIEDLYSF